jgi:predicted permease
MRVYRALLRLYPAAFRVEYGDELCRVFAARCAGATRAWEVPALWLDALADTLVNAARVHWDLLRQDLKYAVRTLLRAPGFTVTATLVAALGIGANTAVFSIADHVFIRPLPYPESEGLVKLWQRQGQYTRMELSPANYRDWRRMSTSFEAMAAFFADVRVNLVGRGEPERLAATAMVPELLPMLGQEPLLGRLFTAEDDRPGAPGTVLLSYALWQRVFGGDPAVLGTTLRLDDEVYTVIGVLPAQFHFPTREVALWLPLRLGEEAFEDRGDNYLQALGRLGDGVSLEQAIAEMTIVTRQLERTYPDQNAEVGATVIPLREEISRQSRLMLAALLGASLCVLLIASTNLASLLLARALGRRQEITVRAVLGAGRERLVRQLVTEALVLALLGGTLGLLAGASAVPLLGALVPTTLPISEPHVDLRVMAFTALLTVLTGLAFGVVPALRVGAGAGSGGLREGSRGGLGGHRERLRGALVIAEVAACVVLLVSCGLLIRALWRVQQTPTGFQADGVLTVQTPLPMPRYAETARRAQLYERILSEVRALPGVEHAAYVTGLPLLHTGGIWSVQAEGELPVPERSGLTASLRFVTPGYFAVMGIPLRLGRDVAESDTSEALAVAVVSESLVRRHWPGQDPIGRRFTFSFRERVVVGVVADVRVRGVERESEPQVYLPHRQVPDGAQSFYAPKELVIRSSSGPAPLASAVRGIVRKADAELPIAALRTLEEVVDSQTTARRTQIQVLAAFAVLALLLAGIGLHGLLSFAVSRRLPEFGLRFALGARAGDVLKMVLREGLVLAGVGAAAGLALAYAAARAMEALLAGVRPGDAATFLTGTLVVLVMALSGSLLPVLRAIRVDPATVLRAE